MFILTRLISRKDEMPDQSDDLTSLRKARYTLGDLPEIITFPQQPGRDTGRSMPVAEATIDDIAFAIIAAEQESSAAYGRVAALQRLYKLTRKAGGIGTDRAVVAALKREGR